MADLRRAIASFFAAAVVIQDAPAPAPSDNDPTAMETQAEEAEEEEEVTQDPPAPLALFNGIPEHMGREQLLAATGSLEDLLQAVASVAPTSVRLTRPCRARSTPSPSRRRRRR